MTRLMKDTSYENFRAVVEMRFLVREAICRLEATDRQDTKITWFREKTAFQKMQSALGNLSSILSPNICKVYLISALYEAPYQKHTGECRYDPWSSHQPDII